MADEMADEMKAEVQSAEEENDIEAKKDKYNEGFKVVTFNEEIEVKKEVEAHNTGNEATVNKESAVSINGERLKDNVNQDDKDDGQNVGNDDPGTRDDQVHVLHVGNGDQGTQRVSITTVHKQEDEHSETEQENTNTVKLGNGDERHEKQIEENENNPTQIQNIIPDGIEGQKIETTEQKEIPDTDHEVGDSIKMVDGTEQPSDNAKLSEEHMEHNMVEREVIPRDDRILNAADDNDSGHEDGLIDLECDENAEVNDDDDDDIEELQKLIEDHHLSKRDTQDVSDAELSNRDNRMLSDQEDQSDKPYYDKVPPISAGKMTSQRLTPNRALIAQIPSPSVKWNSRISTRQSGRFPPAVIKMSTVMLSAKKRRATVVRSMSQYYEDKKHAKLLRWDECVNSRPPLPIDLDLPGPWHYSPNNKPLNETNAPEYSFGMKFYERSGGARTAHAKSWFNSTSSFTTKVNFEKRWPSPAQYSSKPLLGRRHHTLPDFPVYSIGIRSKFAINKKGSEFEPSPTDYYPNKSNSLTLPSAPAYTFGARHTGTCISIGNTDPNNPGPGNYTPRIQYMSTKPHRPAFTIKGVRVPKSHMLGPHATL